MQAGRAALLHSVSRAQVSCLVLPPGEVSAIVIVQVQRTPLHTAASLAARAQTSRMAHEAAEAMGDVSRGCAPWALLECEGFNRGRMRTCWPEAWCSVKRAERLFLPHR